MLNFVNYLNIQKCFHIKCDTHIAGVEGYAIFILSSFGIAISALKVKIVTQCIS